MCVHAHFRFDFGLDPPRAARGFASRLRILLHFQRGALKNSHLPCYTAHFKARPILDLISVDFMRFCAFLQFLSVFAEKVEAMNGRACRSRKVFQLTQIVGDLTGYAAFIQHVRAFVYH